MSEGLAGAMAWKLAQLRSITITVSESGRLVTQAAAHGDSTHPFISAASTNRTSTL